MRIVFFMYHNNGRIQANVLGGFWKIPVKSLDENVLLTDKHVTIAHAGDQYTGILVDQYDMDNIKKKFAPVLAGAYKTMLQQGEI